MAIGATQSSNRARIQVMRLTLAGEVSTRRFRQYAGPVVLALILFEAVSLAVTGEAQGQGEAVWGNPADSGDPPVRSESPAIRYWLALSAPPRPQRCGRCRSLQTFPTVSVVLAQMEG